MKLFLTSAFLLSLVEGAYRSEIKVRLKGCRSTVAPGENDQVSLSVDEFRRECSVVLGLLAGRNWFLLDKLLK